MAAHQAITAVFSRFYNVFYHVNFPWLQYLVIEIGSCDLPEPPLRTEAHFAWIHYPIRVDSIF